MLERAFRSEVLLAKITQNKGLGECVIDLFLDMKVIIIITFISIIIISVILITIFSI